MTAEADADEENDYDDESSDDDEEEQGEADDSTSRPSLSGLPPSMLRASDMSENDHKIVQSEKRIAELEGNLDSLMKEVNNVMKTLTCCCVTLLITY